MRAGGGRVRRKRRQAEAGQEVPFDFGGFDFNDIAEGAAQRDAVPAAGGFRDIFSSMFGAVDAGEPEPQQEPGSDLEYQMNVGFWQAIQGAELQLSVPHLESCAHCHGRGYLESPGVCPECKGKGQVTQKSGSMKFNMPCPRCGGSGKNRTVCNVCHGEGTSGAQRDRSRCASSRARAMGSASGWRDAATPEPWARRRATCTSWCGRASIRSSSATATTSTSRCR